MFHFPDSVMTSLKDTVIKVFWTKRDLRSLLERCDVPERLILAQDWDGYKYHIAAPVLDQLNVAPEGLGPLRRVLQDTLSYTDGNHLLRWPDGQKRKDEAEQALAHLRSLVQKDNDAKEKEEQERQQRHRQAREAQKHAAFQARLEEIKNRFLAYHQNPNRQERGYALEEILYDLFLLFDLSPAGPFRRVGEQIDGAFDLDSQHFLVEAKWQQKPVNLADLRDLDGAVNRGLDNTLGLFVSLGGFSEEALDGYTRGNRPRMICMDAMDLFGVLGGQIDLVELLSRKKEIAATRGVIFAPVSKIMSGAF